MGKKKSENILKEITSVVSAARVESLTANGRQPIRDDHAGNIVQLVLWGHTRLAADHLLFPEINGSLVDCIAGAIRQLSVKFFMAKLSPSLSPDERASRIILRYRAYEYLIETSLNFLGLESRWLDEDEKSLSFEFVLETIASWEAIESCEYGLPFIAKTAVENILASMEIVQGGASMVAKAASRIREEMKGDDEIPTSINFLISAGAEITQNIYYQMVLEERCKFGNDYALGLRWLRHLGFEQVSTNPVLAAKAYDDDASLAAAFKSEIICNPKYDEWKSDPKKHADEITLFATLQALWDNLHVYRPIFYNLEETTGGGVVSFQLNPNLAHLADESITDAFTAMELAQDDLRVYDAYLLAGYTFANEHARPNMVIKVAASNPAARSIAATINSYGLGSNITVIYTVAQECTMILAEMEGMAAAIKKGVLPTQVYMTNMGGRFESHLREEVLLSLFDKLKKKLGEQAATKRVMDLARANCTLDKVKSAKTYRDKVFEAICFKNGNKEIGGPMVKALAGVAADKDLKLLESDIQKTGTLVVRRVWNIFFSDKNIEKWVDWMQDVCDISETQALFIMDRINCLPASKRKPLDTFWTLSSHNMVHTEFGNHQENVSQMSLAEDFDLSDFVESLQDSFDPDVVKRLSAIPDFVKGFEINKELDRIFADAGIAGDFGSGGHTPAQWADYGAVQKTIEEFKAAYNKFQSYVLGIF